MMLEQLPLGDAPPPPPFEERLHGLTRIRAVAAAAAETSRVGMG
jgi:hypothetical protein